MMKGGLIKSLFGTKDPPTKCGGKEPSKNEVSSPYRSSFGPCLNFHIQQDQIVRCGFIALEGGIVHFLTSRFLHLGPTAKHRTQLLTIAQLRQQEFYLQDLCSSNPLAALSFFFACNRDRTSVVHFLYFHKTILFLAPKVLFDYLRPMKTI